MSHFLIFLVTVSEIKKTWRVQDKTWIKHDSYFRNIEVPPEIIGHGSPRNL